MIDCELPRWDEINSIIDKRGPQFIQEIMKNAKYKGSLTEINRLNARFRIVREIRNIEYTTYTGKTAKAYTAMLKAVLTHNVLEQYMRCVYGCHNQNGRKKTSYPQGMRLGSAAQTLFPNEIQSLGTKLDSMDIDQSLLSFLYKEIDHKTNLADYLKERKAIPIRLLADIRNIFSHGKLTAHSNQSDAAKNAEIFECLTESVLDMIGNDFEKRFQEELQKEEALLARIIKTLQRE